MDAMNDYSQITECSLSSTKVTKKSRDPNKSLCFLYCFILHLRMCNANRADHANGCSNAIVTCCITTSELVTTISLIVNWTIVNTETITIGMTPVLIEHVTSIDDIEAQLKRINLTTHLEAILLCEVNIEC